MNISDSDKQALLNGSATIPFKILIKQNGSTIKTLNEHSIVNLDYEDFRYVDTQTICIGQFVARKITGELDQIYTEFEIEDTELELQMGISYYVEENNQQVLHTTYYSLGNFLVTKPTTNEVKEKTHFEALDYTKKFNQVFDATGLNFPCTALDLAEHVCTQCGVELATDDFTNYDFVITDDQYVENDTCRKVMQDIGKLAYSWVRIDADNKCYIDFEVKNTVGTYDTINNTQYYDLSLQKKTFGPVNRVVIGIKDVDGENAIIEDSQSIAQYGVTEIQLYDNNLTYTPELRQQVISSATRLFGLTYLPLEVNTIGHPWLMGNDKIEIVDMNNNSLYTYPWDRTIAYNGHIKTKLASKADTKTETEYKNYGDLETETQRTRIIVDKQNQTITSLAENVSTYDNRISIVEQSVDDISSTVSDIVDSVRNASGYTITLEDCAEGVLQSLTLWGNVFPLYPNTNVYPSDSLFPKPAKFYLSHTYTEENEEKTELIELPFKYLGYINESVCDKFVIDNQGVAKVIRYVGINNDGSFYELDTPIEEDYGSLVISNRDGTNTYVFTPYYSVKLDIDYVIKNALTDLYATKVEVNSKITQTRDSINLEVSRKVDTDDVVSTINQSADQITITGNRFVVDSDNFSLTNDGTMTCEDGNFNGTINSEAGKIGGFSINNVSLYSDIKDKYTYTAEDYTTLRTLISSGNDPTEEELDKYDIDKNGLLDEWDLVMLQWKITNYSSTEGSFSLSTDDANNSIVFDGDGTEEIKTTIGISRLTSNWITGTVIRTVPIGTNETVIDSNGISTPIVTQTSLATRKKNFELFDNALDVVEKVDIYKYNLISESDFDKKHIGVVIGDDFNYSTQITSNDNKGIDLYSMISVCFAAIKEQQVQIDELEKEIESLKGGIK